MNEIQAERKDNISVGITRWKEERDLLPDLVKKEHANELNIINQTTKELTN